MGRWLGRMRTSEKTKATMPGRTPRQAFWHGAAALAGGVVLTTAVAGATAAALAHLGRTLAPSLPARMARISVEGVLLKPALAVRSLLHAADVVRVALEHNDLDQARHLLSWHLVSRNTAALSAQEVAGAAIASLAENLSDSVVGPLMAYRFGGLPAAYAYRFVNTADAMLGYRTPELEWFGKASARADDVLNLLPARVSAPLLAVAAPCAMASPWRGLRCAVRDASRTSSPNGGWPMATMAGALGVRLEKRDLYVLNAEGRDPVAHDITRARRMVLAASLAAVLCVELSIPVPS
jgi:adenosylcobinamide-phosphate synthase